MRLAIASKTGAVLDAYERFFQSHGVTLIHAPSISGLFQTVHETQVNGFVVDIQMVVKATEREKDWLQTMEGVFPNVRTNWNPAVGFRALYNDGGKSGEENLIAFLAGCRDFKPRALRKYKRHGKHFSVLFWPLDASEETAQRAYTLDISVGGLFVGTCDPPPVNSFVWVRLRELDPRPFKLLVKWTLAWGVAMGIPGFGGGFVDLDGELTVKLEAALKEPSGRNHPSPAEQ